ncbi:MAG: hypothetical protein AAFV29_13460 [Myxococcota bacterium]
MVCNDPRVAAYIKDHFIPVANDDVAYRFSQEKTKVAYKVMNKIIAQHDPNVDSQGIYAATSSGQLLYFNGFYSADEVLEGLQSAVAKYKKMSKRERVYGQPVSTRDGIQLAKRPTFDFHDIRVTKRSMPSPRITADDVRHEQFFHFDYLWLKPSEVLKFVPRRRQVGATAKVPSGITSRFVWNNLLVLEHRSWMPGHIKQTELVSKVTAKKGDDLHLELEGRFHMEADWEHNKGHYKGRLLGKMVVSAKSGALKSFEAVALGDDVAHVQRESGGPAENVVGAVFEINQDTVNAKMFPSDFPTGYDW